MKRTIWLLICLLTSLMMSAQKQQGYAKTKGRMVNGQHVKGQGLKGAVVALYGRTSVGVQNVDGSFSFPVAGKSYTVQSVTKNGYQLVDADAAPKAYAYSANSTYLVMETPKQQADNVAAEHKLRRTLQQQLQKREEEIDAMKVSMEEKNRLLAELYKNQESNKKLIADMAKEYAAKALDEYFKSVFGKRPDEFKMPVAAVLKNAHVTDVLGRLTIAGLMFFAKEPQSFRPQFCIKAVWFAGNHIGGTQYHDSCDITGTIPKMYENAMRWLKSCLNQPQNGQSVNSEGILEILEIVLEELVHNTLIHLDLLKPVAIRLSVFDNHIEIVNPGCLLDGQTIEEILMGNSDPYNPQLTQFGSKTMPYRGLGSGIPRVMAENCDVELMDHPNGNQFIARIWRTTQKDYNAPQKANEELIFTTQKEEGTTQKPLTATQKAILDYLKAHEKATKQEVAAAIGYITEDGVKYNIGRLQQDGRLKREKDRKNGCWVVIDI